MQTNIGRCKQIYIDAKFQDRFWQKKISHANKAKSN